MKLAILITTLFFYSTGYALEISEGLWAGKLQLVDSHDVIAPQPGVKMCEFSIEVKSAQHSSSNYDKTYDIEMSFCGDMPKYYWANTRYGTRGDKLFLERTANYWTEVGNIWDGGFKLEISDYKFHFKTPKHFDHEKALVIFLHNSEHDNSYYLLNGSVKKAY